MHTDLEHGLVDVSEFDKVVGCSIPHILDFLVDEEGSLGSRNDLLFKDLVEFVLGIRLDFPDRKKVVKQWLFHLEQDLLRL